MGWKNDKYAGRVEGGEENLAILSLEAIATVFKVDVRELFAEPASRARPRPGRPKKPSSE